MTAFATDSTDRVLLPLNDKLLTAFPFINRTYGRLPLQTIKGVNGAKPTDAPRRLPVVYDENKQGVLPVMPDQNQDGLLFWITTGPVRTRDWQAGAKSYFADYPVALILWWNPKGLQADLAQLNVAKQALLTLASCYSLNVTSVQDQLARSVFAGIDYDFDNHAYLMSPYQGVRIEGILTINESLCQ